MILLVIGLVAVIVVVLIAVFLSVRLGRGDEDDEPEMRPSGRDRRRDQDERWRDRDTRRMPSSARGGTLRGRGGHDGYAARGPARELDSRGRDYSDADYSDAPRRASRPDAPGYRRQAARQAVAASAPARGRVDSPAWRHADDFPSADYPSMDLGPAGGYPADDHPSAEFPAVDHGVMNGRRDSRRKAEATSPASKGRSRQRGKRDDDDDWPSSEWDKLSDEQYWAELSADKPLSSMARPARKPARDPAATATANGAAKARPARDSRSARPAAPEHDLPSRKDRAEREPATERLPVRPAARQAPPPPGRPDTGAAAASRSYPEPHALLDSGPRASRDTGPHRTRDTGPRAALDTGPQPRPDRRWRDTTGPHAARDREAAMPAGAPPPIPGALEDDPLTSPSFSLKSVPASDSRSYSNARKHAKTTGQPAGDATYAHRHDGAHANGNGSYPAADQASPGYAYQSAPPAAVPPPAPASDWYSAPPAPAAPYAEAQTPAYGNPYQYPGGSNGGSAAGFPDHQATAGYLADPLRVYSPPSYAEPAPAPYAEPAAPAAYQALPNGATVPYADGYSGHPYAGQAGYQDGYHAGHVAGYEEGYQADPYAVGGYRPYPPQG